jgi:hypothetical protein
MVSPKLLKYLGVGWEEDTDLTAFEIESSSLSFAATLFSVTICSNSFYERIIITKGAY